MKSGQFFVPRQSRAWIAAAFAAALTGTVHAQPQVTVNLNDMDVAGYFLASYSPIEANVGMTGSSNLNTTMSLRYGTRYNFVYTNAGSHPFEVIAKGANSGLDTTLLSLGGAGSMEGNAGVQWAEAGTSFTFILTGPLADAMVQSGNVPGYRCQFHPDDMRGNIVFAAAISPLEWPSGIETFENYSLGASVPTAITGWTIVDAAVPTEYEGLISDSPSGHPNQTTGSTRWLTITDTENNAAANGRTYSNSIIVPGTTIVNSYKFTWKMDIESLGSAGPLIIVQHRDNTSAYRNVGGLQVTATGLNALVQGSDGGNIGKAGADSTAPLYLFSDSGGFGQSNWVTAEFELDFVAGVINARAVGSDGVTQKTAQAVGLDLQNSGRNDFRFCIRNNGSGNTSVISYDDLALSGVEGNASAANWREYE